MGSRWWGSFLGAFILVATVSGVALALPGFSDRNIAAGNLNPTDRILVQQVRITGDSSKAVTIGSATVQNLGTASSEQIDRIEIFDGGTALGDTTNLAGLTTAGVTINLGGYSIPSGTTHEIRIYVTVGATVAGSETVSLRVKFYYQMDSTSYTSSWISDLTGETIRNGGFDSTADTALDATFFNPNDESEVQVSTFTDSDANGNNVLWQGTAAGSKILEVENLGTATVNDVALIRVVLTIDGVEYVTWDAVDEWVDWAPGSAMPLNYGQFKELSDHTTALPVFVPDNSTMTVKVEMKIEAVGSVTDGRTIRARVKVFVTEGNPGDEVAFEQTVTSSTTQTVRKQGFERIVDESVHVASGTKAGGDYLEQVIKVSDDDVNASNVRLLQVNVRNAGTAGGAELHSIKIMRGGTTLAQVIGLPGLTNFKTGLTITLTTTPDAADDGDLTIKIYYNIGTPIDGHTLRPVVKVQANEPAAPAPGSYWSDEVAYRDEIVLYAPGFEVVENLTPPEGGTAYSSQRFLAQLIRCEDLDENDDNVTIHPVVVKNLGTAQENPDIVKIEVMRRDTQDGSDLLMGSTTTLTGFRTSGVTIPTQTSNVVADAVSGAEVFLAIYLTVAEPEQMVAGRTIQLETRVLHTEAGVSYDKSATSNQWTLAVNHRPTVDFTFSPATPKYTDTITFTPTATDQDGDAISGHAWNFGDTTASTAEKPTHTYPAGGTFQVTVTVTDARGVTGTKTKTVTVEGPPNQPAVVSFIWTPTAPGVGQSTSFTATVTDVDQPSGTAFTYLWDFGDSTTSVLAAPSHAFAEKKSYTITLKVTDSASNVTTVTHTLVIGNAPPVANFQASKTAVAVAETITFTDSSTDSDGTVSSWAWNFGDGGTSNSKSPTHPYGAAGTYTVTLTVTDDKGSASAPKTLVITVSGPTGVVTYSYPNPASTQATIAYFFPAGSTSLVLHIYDLSGRLVHEADLDGSTSTYPWDLVADSGDTLPTGLYFYVITGKDAALKAIASPIFKLLIAR